MILNWRLKTFSTNRTGRNILAFLAKVILDNMRIEMNTLIQSILFLSGTIAQLPDIRKVSINKKQKRSKVYGEAIERVKEIERT